MTKRMLLILGLVSLAGRIEPQDQRVYQPDASDILIADFEGTDYAGWTATGEAFGTGPAKKGKTRNKLEPFVGSGLANTFLPNDKSTGTLVSPPFKVERKHINFLIGGGNHPGKTELQLLVEDRAVRKASGFSKKNKNAQEVIDWKSWDVAEFIGKLARLKIIDQHSSGWGHILVDHVFQSDRAMKPPPAESVPPVKPGVTLKDEWSTFPHYSSVGYDQSLRPQFHFTSRMNWLNDPNGMVYYDGEWHMYFQHVAIANNTGPKSWGNAKSTDLVHWKQYPHAINPYPNIHGKEGNHTIWSGSAVVDVLNALGKQKGEVKTLFALYTATNPDGFFQGGAYSTDKGRTWTKINDGKPVIPHQEGFSKGQRDPRIFYYAPGRCYYTIMMVGGKDRAVRLWKSTNLLDWEHAFDIPNKAAECIDMYEAPLRDAEGSGSSAKRWVIADARTVYEVGEFDGKSWKGSGASEPNEKPLRFDYGDAYYAAQVFNQAPNGRVVHIGWLRSKQAGYRPFLEANMPFTQQMSIPAEITLRTTPDGIRMFRTPVREIEKLYRKTETLENLTAGEANTKLRAFQPELVDMTLRCAAGGDFTLKVRGLRIRYDSKAREFVFTNHARVAGEKAAMARKPKARQRPYRDDGVRRIPAPPAKGKVSLRALVDRASLEIFVNDGQAAASFVVVPKADERRIMIEGNDNLAIDLLTVNELKSIW